MCPQPWQSDGSELLEEVSLLTPRYKLDAHQNYILKTVFSPDGRYEKSETLFPSMRTCMHAFLSLSLSSVSILHSFCLSICLSVFLSFCLSVCLCICQSIHLLLFLSIHPSVCVSALSACLCVCMCRSVWWFHVLFLLEYFGARMVVAHPEYCQYRPVQLSGHHQC